MSKNYYPDNFVSFLSDWQCPWCGTKLNSFNVANEQETPVPGPGDLSICIKCARPAIFNEHMELLQFEGELDEETLQLQRDIKATWSKLNQEQQ